MQMHEKVKRKLAKQSAKRPAKRMKSSQYPRPQAFHDRLVGVFSFDNAIPVINEYLASIWIDADNRGFLLNWNIDNLKAFVATANDQLPANAPRWMQTPPPHMTANTLVDDIVRVLREDAGGGCGRVLLAPNNMAQYGNIMGKLRDVQSENFMRVVGQVAFGKVEQHLATTYNLTENQAQQSVRNHITISLNGSRLFE
ncbi:hypothetical protein V7S43_013533 [Phytophthora oleae]|uniref:Uncharacterized protein n=1 Tax=Phytophthora oleae TaxID=2107226 RepID=A0ABD3F3N0_9STRA